MTKFELPKDPPLAIKYTLSVAEPPEMFVAVNLSMIVRVLTGTVYSVVVDEPAYFALTRTFAVTLLSHAPDRARSLPRRAH